MAKIDSMLIATEKSHCWGEVDFLKWKFRCYENANHWNRLFTLKERQMIFRIH